MQDTEKFYPFKGYEGFYEITKSGIVKSLGRFVNTKGNSRRFKKESIKKSHFHRDGYLQISLFIKNKTLRRPIMLHRLLALNFIPNPNNYPMVNHIDGNKTNNNLANLEWCSAKQNSQHYYDIGFKTPNRHLTCDDAYNIRLEYKKWIGLQKDFKIKMAEKYNVSKYVIHDIILNRSYKNLNLKT